MSAPRSGSTLLRQLVDAHPDAVSPPELNFGPLAEGLRLIWNVVEPPGPGHARRVARRIRAALEEVMAVATEARHAALWCEKSVTSVDHLDLLYAIFPDARYVFLHRNCLDLVSSCIHVSRWGLGTALVERYGREQPDNFVDAFVRLWTDTNDRMLKFQQEHPHASLRLRYEELVTEPEPVARAVFSFLGLAWDPHVLSRMFQESHGVGPGDPRAARTDHFSTISLGAGAGVPTALLAPETLDRVDALHEVLGYDPIDRTNTKPSPYVIRHAPTHLAVTSTSSFFTEHLTHWRPPQGSVSGSVPVTIGVVVEDEVGGVWTLHVGPGGVRATQNEARDVDHIVVTRASTLLQLANGLSDPVEAARRGDLRAPSQSLDTVLALGLFSRVDAADQTRIVPVRSH